MRVDVRAGSGVGRPILSIRGLLFASVIAGGLILVGCGGSLEEGASVDISEETTTEETTQGTTDSSKSELASAPKAKNDTISCAGFGSPGGAEQFFFSATPEQKEALDPNGNGIPCDEAGNEANPQNKAPGGGPKANQKVNSAMEILDCQLEEVGKDLGLAKAEQFVTEIVDEAMASGTDIQTLLAEKGYTCDGQAADVLGEGN